MNNETKLFIFLNALIIFGLCSRWLPFADNFSPMIVIPFFVGIYASSIGVFSILIFSLAIISDLFLGFHSASLFVYLSYLLIGFAGFSLRSKVGFKGRVAGSVGGSFIFFLVSNFGVWLTTSIYPKNFAGLFECYLAGAPFYRNTFASAVVFGVLFFLATEIAERKYFQKQAIA